MQDNVIVSPILQFSPPIEPTWADLRRFQVEFPDGSKVWSNPEAPMARNWNFALQQLHTVNLPVYIEVDPETQTIRDLQVPIRGRIAALRRRPGGLRIALDGSVCCWSLLRESNPDYRVLEQVLVEAQQGEVTITLTRKTGEGVIDVRLSPVHAAPPTPIIPFLYSAETLPPVTMEVVNEMFALVYGQDCNPSAGTPTCIPFQFPDCGCEARAHQMCKLMIASGKSVLPGKVFSVGALTVQTAYSPSCKVTWPCHIAPRLTVNKKGRGIETMIIDPSLFRDGPVTQQKWLSVQSATTPLVFQTSWESYEPDFSSGGYFTDPDFSKTDSLLAACRAALAVRNPPPPYPCP